jgi:preprotein translocase subunit SecE
MPRKNQRKRNLKNQQLSEREGTNLFNKSYELINKPKNKAIKNILINKDNYNDGGKSKNVDNKFKRTFDDFQEVKKEVSKVKWPSKKDMIKYSVATISFIVFSETQK